MRYLLVIPLLFAGCQGIYNNPFNPLFLYTGPIQNKPAQAQQIAQPHIKIISEDIRYEEDVPRFTAFGRVFFTNISRVPAVNVKIQVVFFTEGEILGVVEKSYFEDVLFDQVKEFAFEKEMFVATNKPVEMMINSWYKGSYQTVYRR